MGGSILHITESLQKVSNMLDRLLHTREELALRHRDKRMLAVFEKKHVTSAEIYEADFGTKCPNGLDIKSYPGHEQHFVRIEDTNLYDGLSSEDKYKELSKISGLAQPDGKIILHPDFWNDYLRPSDPRRLSSVVSHEHAHTNQFYEMETGWPSAFMNEKTDFLRLKENGNGMGDHAKSLYQKFNQAAVDKKAEERTQYKVSSYFSREEEIQARMHEVLAIGYAGWQKMPTSKIELWAALHGLGIETPENILTELKNSEEGRKALKTFNCSKNIKRNSSQVADDLNLVDDYATFSSVREVLWRTAYPAMYGNLLEHYGDTLGRERMGLGHNPAAAKEVAKAVMKNPSSLDKKTIKSLVLQVHPENASELINVLGYISEQNPIKRKKAVRVIEEIMSHNHLRSAVLEHNTYFQERGLYSQPPLFMAVLNGRKDIVKSLIENGADPFSTMRIINYAGKEVGENNVFGYIPVIQNIEQALADPDRMSKDLRNVFNNESYIQHQRDQIDKIKEAFQVIADHYTALDEVRPMRFRQGTIIKTVTARTLLADIGITPDKQNQSTGERMNNENHVAFRQH